MDVQVLSGNDHCQWAQTQAQPCSASSAEQVWSAYGRVHTDALNRMLKNHWAKTRKLVKVYFNSRALQKVRKVEWESKAFQVMWYESKPLAESDD